MNAAVIMLTYLIGTVLIGLFYAKKNKDVQQYLVAKRNLGIGLIIPLMFAELIAGAGTVGNATDAFKSGFSSVWANWGMVIGCWMFILLGIGKFFRAFGQKRGIMSVPEAYKFLFDKKTAVVMMAIFALVYSIIFAMQPVAAAAILGPMFKVSVPTMSVIVGAIMIIVTLSGGLTGLAWMNVLHSFVMYLGMLIVAWFTVGFAGGWSVLTAKLPATFFSFVQPDLWTVIAWGLGTGLSFLCAATVGGVCFGAKTDKIANKGILIGSFLVIPFALLPALTGMAAKVALPSIKATDALFGMANHVSPFLGGLASMAIIAAIFSTAPALLLITATTLTRDFYKGLVKPGATDQEQLMFSRIMVILVGIISIYFGLQARSILATLLGAFQIRSIAGVVLAVALFWPRVTKDAAFWSIAVGGSMAAFWHFAKSPFGIAPLWPSLGVGLFLLVVITMLSKEPVSEGYKRYKEIMEEYDHNQEDTNVPA